MKSCWLMNLCTHKICWRRANHDANILIAVSGLADDPDNLFRHSDTDHFVYYRLAVPAIVILSSYSVWPAVSGVGELEHLKTIVPQTLLNFSSSLYASSLGFANITGLSSHTLSVVNGIIGTACALWLYNSFDGIRDSNHPRSGYCRSLEPPPLCRLQHRALYSR